MTVSEGESPWIRPTTDRWQTLEPLQDWHARWSPPWRYVVPVRLERGAQSQVLALPIRMLPGSVDRGVASLIANQASFAVADALTERMAELAKATNPEAIVGLPTLGLAFAPGIARALHHERWIPLGYSRKFWYDEALSTAVASITTPVPGKRLYLDPNQKPLVAGSRILLVDDVASSGQTLRRVWELMELLGATVVGAVVAMCQGEQWRVELGAERANRVHGAFSTPLLWLGGDGWRPL